jgi:hypothetical protein
MHAACYLLAVVHAAVVRRGGVSFAFFTPRQLDETASKITKSFICDQQNI